MVWFRASLSLLIPLAACAAGARDIEWDAFARSERPLPGAETRDGRELSADEEGLAREARLEPIVRLVLARDPELLEERDRVHAQAAAAFAPAD